MGQRRAAPGRPHERPRLRHRRAHRFISETCTLEPGDLILTGTPDGVGMAMDPPQFLEPGDVVAIEIERLGRIEHPVV
jgi:2-keto-4-pentenoate hydratase/2-oxohepta-3-ene-1,7-dioic acid hydratase in catechol pathway